MNSLQSKPPRILGGKNSSSHTSKKPVKGETWINPDGIKVRIVDVTTYWVYYSLSSLKNLESLSLHIFLQEYQLENCLRKPAHLETWRSFDGIPVIIDSVSKNQVDYWLPFSGYVLCSLDLDLFLQIYRPEDSPPCDRSALGKYYSKTSLQPAQPSFFARVKRWITEKLNPFT